MGRGEPLKRTVTSHHAHAPRDKITGRPKAKRRTGSQRAKRRTPCCFACVCVTRNQGIIIIIQQQVTPLNAHAGRYARQPAMHAPRHQTKPWILDKTWSIHDCLMVAASACATARTRKTAQLGAALWSACTARARQPRLLAVGVCTCTLLGNGRCVCVRAPPLFR